MDRDGALAYLQGVMSAVMTLAGKDTDDDLTGFGPALDRAFTIYIAANGLTTTVNDTDTAAADLACFTALLEAVAYDLAMPCIGLNSVDFSVDAPLTNVKRSQTFRQLSDLRAQAWQRANSCGYADWADNVGGIRVNLDFLEPHPTAGTAEFG